MKKLRLVLFKECNRSCAGCCNKDWDLDNLELCQSFKGYDEIILTGGEPMLRPELIKQVVKQIRKENPQAKIYMYTAYTYSDEIFNILSIIDGLTLTLHDVTDILPFWKFHYKLINENLNNKSLRLNIFDDVTIYNDITLNIWEVKDNMIWIKDKCLPDNEVLMRYYQ